MTTFKILVNSTLSTPGAKWLGLDVNNYYLGTPMDNYEYMFIPINQIHRKSLTIIIYTTLYIKAKSMWKFAVVCTAFPKQESSPKNNFIHFLGSYSYSPVPHTPGLWCHQWRPITFCLVVNDFGVKYIGKEHADHVIQCLRNHYKEIEIVWAGKRFCGIQIWDYTNRTCDLSMPVYVQQTVHKFQHPPPNKPQDSPYPATVKQYSVKVQLADPIGTSACLPTHEIKRL